MPLNEDTEWRPTLWQVLTCSPLTAKDRRNQWIAVGWLLAWQGVWITVITVIANRELAASVVWALIAIATLAGLWAITVYRRFVLGADELHRKIQLDSMAAGFAAAVLGSTTLQLIADGFGSEFEASATMVIGVLAYAISTVVLTRRYA